MRTLSNLILCAIVPLMVVSAPAGADPAASETQCILGISTDARMLSMNEDVFDEIYLMAVQSVEETTGAEMDTGAAYMSPTYISLYVRGATSEEAKASLNDLVVALRSLVIQPFNAYAANLQGTINSVEDSRHMAQARLDRLLGQEQNAPDPRTPFGKAMNATVDLSVWGPDMPFAEALDVLKNSVEPPLQIAAMWKDLMDRCDVDQGTPIDMDGLFSAKVGTALELLLKAMSTSGNRLGYRIQDGIIIIEPTEDLTALTQPASPADIEALRQRRGQIMNEVQALELDQASLEARRIAIEEQLERAQLEARDELGCDTVTVELQKLVDLQANALAQQRQQVEYGRLPESALSEAQENLAKAKIELARRREDLTWSASGGRLTNLSGQLSQIAIDRAEKNARLDILRRHLADVEKELSQIAAFEAQAAQIESAKMEIEALSRKRVELETELASLPVPLVTVIRAD